MKIGCLGWGSLVWDPRDLLIRRKWFSDGPLLPVEFCRESSDGRITLVLVPERPRVRTFWAIFSTEVLHDAVESLRAREGMRIECVGQWLHDDREDSAGVDPEIQDWGSGMRLDAVLWTALPPKFNGHDGEIPSAQQVLDYLQDPRRCGYEKRRYAEQYVRRAPIQIDTEYRRLIEMQLGWLPIET